MFENICRFYTITFDAVFHSQDLNFCNHVTLTTVSWTENGKPDEVIGIIENVSDAYKSENYVCFQEQLPGILDIIGKTGAYEPAWEAYITGYIEEQDQKSVREFIDITTLAERIGDKNSITITYKRKEIGWTRGQFLVGKRDENGLPLTVIYTVADINQEMEIKMQKVKAEQ